MDELQRQNKMLAEKVVKLEKIIANDLTVKIQNLNMQLGDAVKELERIEQQYKGEIKVYKDILDKFIDALSSKKKVKK